MNILASYRYQMKDHKNSVLLYYLVIFIVFIVINSMLWYVPAVDLEAEAEGGGSMDGNEMVTLIFLFVVGLCSFKETFLFSLQNGVSRKTLFCSKLLTMVSIAAIMSAIDVVFLLAERLITYLQDPTAESVVMYSLLYEQSDKGSAVYLIPNFFMEFLLALAVMAVGYFITILFYRLDKKGKILVGAGVPIFLNIVFPVLDFRLFNWAITNELSRLMLYIMGRPSHLFVSAILVFAVFSAAAFLLMRRAVVKRR